MSAVRQGAKGSSLSSRRIFVRKVELEKTEAMVGESLTVYVTEYSKPEKDVPLETKKKVRWKIRVGDKEKDFTGVHGLVLGSKILFAVREEWEGKEVVFMPYLIKHDKTVYATLKVGKWDLPKIIVETTRIEGKMPDRKSIADDMHFGIYTNSIHVHTGNFSRENLASVVRAAMIKELSFSDDKLFERFEELVRYTSREPLRTANLALVAKMRSQKTTNIHLMKALKPEEHINATITNAVFEHKSSENFITEAKGAVIKLIKEHHGNINIIDEAKIIRNIQRPQYSSRNDQINGLQIALNDTWGHRVMLTTYDYNFRNKTFTGKLHIRIFDHFGLDMSDINKFGTAGLIREHLPNIIDAVNYIPSRLIKITMEETIRHLLETAAAGFRAWFILQHYRGYRPFVTVMEKEIAIEG